MTEPTPAAVQAMTDALYAATADPDDIDVPAVARRLVEAGAQVQDEIALATADANDRLGAALIEARAERDRWKAEAERWEVETERMRLHREAEYTQGLLHYDRAERLEAQVQRVREYIGGMLPGAIADGLRATLDGE